MQRSIFEPAHDAFREVVRDFVVSEALSNFDRFRAAGIIDREYFLRAAECGLLGLDVAVEHGGHAHDDYRFAAVVLEEFEMAGVGSCGTGIMLQNDIVAPYLTAFGTAQQQSTWLPGLCRGRLIGALAITEPGTGSDISAVAATAVADGDGYRVNGSKLYIGCGVNADFVITVVRTDPTQRHRGLSMLVIERGTEGFRCVQNVPRAGREPQDVAELAFEDVWVPRENLLGAENAAFGYLMHNLPQERMQVAVSAAAACTFMFETTLDYVKQRQIFGQAVGSFQHNKFVMAEMATELSIAQTYVDACIRELLAGTLTAVEAAKAKWWLSEMQVRFANQCFQLHGARGFMGDLPITRSWRDARVTTIYAGSTEVMKEIIGRSLGL